MSQIIEDFKSNCFLPVCNTCKNHILYNKCKAFDVIPYEILFLENNHTKPLKGQKNNIVFEPIKTKK